MPNQFYPRGYYGYPYPQQNAYPPMADPYAQYPYMTAGAQQMPPRPYMQNMVYMDNAPYMQRAQYDYPYQPYPYPAPNPYEMAPMAPNPMGMPMGQPSYGAVPSVPPAYAMPLMQTPTYGYDYSQSPYAMPYPGQAYPQYPDPAQAYWPDYQPNAYAPQYAPQAGGYPYGQDMGPEFEEMEIPRRKRSKSQKASQDKVRVERRAKKQNEERKRMAEQKKQEELLEQAALKDARIKQRKRREAQEAANEEALMKEISQQTLRKQRAAQQASSQKPEEVSSVSNQVKRNVAKQEKQAQNATAAAAASIAAFHEAAKSVNEVNLNEAAEAIKAKPETIQQPTGRPRGPLSKLRGKGSSPKEADAAKVEAGNIDLPSSLKGKSIGATPQKADSAKPDETLAMPKAEDVVVVSDEKISKAKGGKKGEVEIEKTTELVVEEKPSDKNSENTKDVKVGDATTKTGVDAEKKGDAADKQEASTEKKEVAADKLEKAPLSPIAIVGLVFGIVGIALAAIAPILNPLGYAALAVGVLALIVSAVAIFNMKNKTKSGKPAAIAGVVCGLLAIVLAIILHLLVPADSETPSTGTSPNSPVWNYTTSSSSSSSSYTYSYNSGTGSGGQASDSTDTTSGTVSDAAGTDSTAGSGTSATSGVEGSNTSGAGSGTTNGTDTSTASDVNDSQSAVSSMDVTPTGAHEGLSVGSAVDYSNGLSVAVDSVDNNLANTAGDQIVCVTVTYRNNGTSPLDYNSFDWKAKESDGKLKTYAIYPSGENELNNGELMPGSSITGNLYFEGPIKEVIYEANYWNSDNNATWKV